MEVKLAAGRDGLGAVPRSMWESFSAFANTDGGRIVLGARERDDGTFVVEPGIDLETLRRTVWAAVGNREIISHQLVSNDDVRIVEVTGGEALVVAVPRARPVDRPVYVGSNPFGATYVRNHDGDHRCSDGDVKRMLAEADPETGDRTAVSGADIAAFDVDSVMAFRNAMASRNPAGHPFLAGDDEQFLRSIGALVPVDGEQLRASRAGVLMLGTHVAIHELYPDYQVDYRLVDDSTTGWNDRVTSDGSFSGNLYDFYRRVYRRLVDDVHVPFQLDEDERRDYTPVHGALREALVNALAHASFDTSGGIVVLRYPDRYEFSNPGRLRVRAEDLESNNQSVPRSPTILAMFQLVGLSDRAGSGYPRIFEAWSGQSWRAPELREAVEPDRFTLTLTMSSLLPQARLDELEARFGSAFTGLDEPGRIAVVTAAVEGWVTNARLRQLVAIHPADATRALQQLVSMQLLEQDGIRRGASYRLGIGAPADNLFTSSLSDSDASLSDSDASLSDSDASLSDSDEVKAPPRRSRQVDLQQRVIEAAAAFATAEEIAAAAGRTRAHVHARAISPLVERGYLEQQFPNSARHPKQSYRATAAGREWVGVDQGTRD